MPDSINSFFLNTLSCFVVFISIDYALQIGMCCTGKLQELAIKHFSWAFSCKLFANSTWLASVMVTLGCKITALKCPPPPSFSTMIPSAASVYAVTTMPLSAQKCKNHNMWHELNAYTNMSSGLCLVPSPLNGVSAEHKISTLFSIERVWFLLYEA